MKVFAVLLAKNVYRADGISLAKPNVARRLARCSSHRALRDAHSAGYVTAGSSN
jgi:hypothetical protein